MQQLTVKTLIEVLKKQLRQNPEIADKKVVVADDNEGNGYHGMFYVLTVDEQTVKEVLEFSNISDSETDEPSELVLLG